jgi:SAM-dependent methyltransferase
VTTSIAWYDANADSYVARTFGPGMEDLHARFLRHIPDGARLLDAGCGSGRDALAFKRAGYDVSAFDGSARLAVIASANTGLPVRCLTFAQMDWDAAFDGVWACATLLHLPAAELPAALDRIRRALRPGGVFYASFKEGAGERLANGRHFTDQTVESLMALLRETRFEPIEVWRSLDERANHVGEIWVSGLARRPANDGIAA